MNKKELLRYAFAFGCVFTFGLLGLAACTQVSEPQNVQPAAAPGAPLHQVADLGTCTLYRLQDGGNTIYVTSSGVTGNNSSRSCSLEVVEEITQ